MQENHKMLLRVLLNNDVMSSLSLAQNLSVSTRTIRSYISQLRIQIEPYGATIEAQDSGGYKLLVENPKKFLQFLQTLESEEQRPDFNNKLERMKYIIERIFYPTHAVSVEVLAEEMYLSDSQVTVVLNEIKKMIRPYSLWIKHIPHQGMVLQGNELQKRRYLAEFDRVMEKGVVFNMNQSVAIIENIVVTCLKNSQIQLSDTSMNNLVTHLYIAKKRIENQQKIEMDEEMLHELQQEKEYEIAQNILYLMQEKFSIDYSDNECGYITIHLASKKMHSQNSAKVITEDVMDLVEIVLCDIQQELSVDLSKDLNLKLNLGQHISILENRIQYSLFMQNPMLSEIKERFVTAYELALVAGKRMNEHYQCELTEEEIGFFALHFNVALEKHHRVVRKNNVLIVCSSGVGSAELLRYNFEENFPDYLSKLTVTSAHRIDLNTLDEFDFIFSTIPLDIQTSVPIILINHLIGKQDVEVIKKHLMKEKGKSISDFQKSELFFTDLVFETKEEVLKFLTNEAKKYYELPNDFLSEILKREEIAPTEINSLVGFPHPRQPITNETFTATAVLKKPVLWGENEVKFIFLASIEKGDSKNMDYFYRTTSRFLSSKENIYALVKQPSFEYFIELVEGLDGEN